MELGRNFHSDNVAPACEAVIAAVSAANSGSAASYGGDEVTARLQSTMSQVFETEVAVFPVTTGTAANSLALSQLVPPYGAVYCYEAAHIVTDECGAPEFFSGGAKLIGFPAADGRIRPEQLEHAIAFAEDMGVHHVKPAAVSLTQATEWGTVYSLSELAEITAVAKSHRLPVHMDGARFANALVHLNCSPAEATWKRGVDVLSLGATKNGALCAEAVVFFDPSQADDFGRRRKRAGHLWSKMRFLSAQLLAYLTNGLWLENARHANAMATRMAQGLRKVAGSRLLHPVEANELFVALPEATVAHLEKLGFQFYRWPLSKTDSGVAIRLVTSFATSSADVDEFIGAAQRSS
ncbi:MAG TPA: low specificity L-threonine aldolase [Steroidobacteraceae bacterium]|jgi:threonine aldolase|nr:low specificity L-threonine aldolase [Steroidobacteraceae bacterium]